MCRVAYSRPALKTNRRTPEKEVSVMLLTLFQDFVMNAMSIFAAMFDCVRGHM